MAGGHGDLNVFQLARDTELLPTTAVMTALIVFVLLLSAGLAKAEHVIRGKRNSKFLDIYNRMMEELTVMGMISFIIFMSNQFFNLSTASYYISLEFCHIVLFFISLIFVVQAIWLMRMSETINNKWSKYAYQTKGSLIDIYKQLQDDELLLSTVPVYAKLYSKWRLRGKLKVLHTELEFW